MASTTERGLGWSHQKQRANLLRYHQDGNPCPCQPGCGPGCLCLDGPQPMYRNAADNIDGMPLEADHTQPRSLGGTVADRLMLATCNRSRGNGTRHGPGGAVVIRDW